MKFGISLLLGFAGLILGKPQIPTPPSPPPDIPPPSDEPPTPVPPPPSTATDPPKSTISTVVVPTETGEPGQGPICQCGYTYCAAVLMAMKVPWSEERLAEAYCTTANAACEDSKPPTNVTSSLFICLCDDEGDKNGTDLDLICGCDTCLNIGPDYRGRCKTPCQSGPCYKKSGGSGWFL